MIQLYNINEPNNKIDKVTGECVSMECSIKDATDMLNPVITIMTDKYPEFNYAYLTDFKRYYYINNIKVKPNRIYTLYLKIDVLKSYADEIKNCYGTVIKTSGDVNNYYDSDYPTEVRKEIDIYKSNKTIPNKSTMLLTTIGSGDL